MGILKNKDAILDMVISTVIALFAGFLAGALLLLASGYDPISAYALMLEKVAGDWGQVIGKATPLIFTGLAVAIPYSVGMINLGAEGQVVAGALVSAIVGAQVTGLPPLVHIPLVLFAGAISGMLFSAFCGWAKLRFGANEVVTTVMLNSVVLLLAEYCANGPLNGVPSQPQTAIIQDSAKLSKFYPTDSWSTGIFIAVAAALISWVFLKRTVLGYEMRAAGLNQVASRYKGINISATALLAMALGGALAGMGGACEVMGVKYSYYQGFVTNYGYTGMGVALIAWNNPIAVIPSAVFLAAIRVGGMALDRLTDIPSHFIWVLQGAMIIAMAIRGLRGMIVQGCRRVFRRFFRKSSRTAE